MPSGDCRYAAVSSFPVLVFPFFPRKIKTEIAPVLVQNTGISFYIFGQPHYLVQGESSSSSCSVPEVWKILFVFVSSS